MTKTTIMSRAMIGGKAVGLEALFSQQWDYLIIGAGSAGCVLARRLSDDADMRILVLEAGDVASDPAIFVPAAWPGLAGGVNDWNYQSTPQPGLLNRAIAQPRGKGMGGSTLINALGYQRGPMQAYDRWAEATDDAGWSGQGLLPYFRRLETTSSGADKWRGGDGPLQILEIGDVSDQNPYSAAIAEAGVAAGHPLNPDWNGPHADGTIWTQLTMRAGRRDTAASAFVEPVQARPNLGIATGIEVRRIIIADGQCLGVDLVANGACHQIRPERETILSAGALDSARLLLLSGIGDADSLTAIDIVPLCDSPDVGRNLQDHPLVPGLLFRSPQPVPLSHYNHCETMVIARSRHAPEWGGDLQLMALSVPFLSPELGTPPPQSFSIVPALMHPRSRGSIRLASADPSVPALIDPAYLSDERDVEALVDALEIARDIAHQPAMRDWIAEELFPGPQMTDRAMLAHHVRRTASPFFHPVSTCRMGSDATAVTDPQCRVNGIGALRVVDASIMPSIPQAMTNAAVLALAERAADIIRGVEAIPVE